MAVAGLVIIAISGERMADTPAPEPASDLGLEAGQELPPEPDGYRGKAYRAPVPDAEGDTENRWLDSYSPAS